MNVVHILYSGSRAKYLMFFISILIFIASLSFALSWRTDPSPKSIAFSLADFVNPLTYIGIGGIAVFSVWTLFSQHSQKVSKTKIVLLVFLLMFLVFILRDLVAPTPVGTDALGVSISAENLTQNGVIEQQGMSTFFPGLQLLMNSIGQLCGTDASFNSHAMLIVFALQFSFLLSFIATRSGLSSKTLPLFLFFFIILTSFFFEFQVVPQTAAFLASMTILGILAGKVDSSPRWIVALLPLIGFVTITHIYAPLITIAVCGLMGFFSHGKTRKICILTSMILAFAYADWMLLHSGPLFSFTIQKLFLAQGALSSLGPAASFTWHTNVLGLDIYDVSQVASYILFFGLFIIGSLLLLGQRKVFGQSWTLLQTSMVLGVGILAIPTIFFDASGAHMLDRLSVWLLLALIPSIDNFAHRLTDRLPSESILASPQHSHRQLRSTRGQWLRNPGLTPRTIAVILCLLVMFSPFSIMRLNSSNAYVFLNSEDSMFSFAESYDVPHGSYSSSPLGQSIGSGGNVSDFIVSLDIHNESQLRNMDVIMVDHWYYSTANYRGWYPELNDVVANDSVIFDVGTAYVAVKA